MTINTLEVLFNPLVAFRRNTLHKEKDHLISDYEQNLKLLQTKYDADINLLKKNTRFFCLSGTVGERVAVASQSRHSCTQHRTRSALWTLTVWRVNESPLLNLMMTV